MRRYWNPSTRPNLGLLYANQGRLKDAEMMYKRALDGYEKEWGPGHTSTLNTINNLGTLYANQGRLKRRGDDVQPYTDWL